MVFPCLYNAPVLFFGLLVRNPENCIVEVFDHYSKQTYRNRMQILGANGMINLVIPVQKDHGKKTFMRDIRIDYDTNWQKIHWRSIVSAYASAPFFEFLGDSFEPFYTKRYTYLVDLNTGLMEATLKLLQLSTKILRTQSFLHIEENDLRELIHPKRKQYHTHFQFNPVVYQQVFSDRHGFTPNLSIIDLLFNEGSNAIQILKDSIYPISPEINASKD